VVIAVSGGIDSTALLLAMKESGMPIIAAHVNHHLRGAESDGDEAFVRELCSRIGVELHVADGTLDPAAVRDRGIEAAAREIRHQRLREIAGEAWIATAHQKNDQAETVLMRLTTGGGIAALRGIHPVRDDRVIRPLLEVTRAETEAFLKERGVVARIDRSNADPRFLRNRIRRILGELGPEAIDNLAAIADQAREQWTILERVIDAADKAETTSDETRFSTWPDDPWLRRALLHRHIRRLDPHCREVSAADLERLESQLQSLKRVSVTANLELLRRNGVWILRHKPPAVPPFEAVIHPGESVWGLIVKRQPEIGNFQLPKGADPVFTIRNRRPGDRFQPLGMSKAKKLKDFLIDRKIAVESRDRLPLLIWNGQIVCIAGVEVSEQFKVTGGGDIYEVAMDRLESHCR